MVKHMMRFFENKDKGLDYQKWFECQFWLPCELSSHHQFAYDNFQDLLL